MNTGFLTTMGTTLLAILLIIALAGCAATPAEPTVTPVAEKTQITVSILPQQYFVERIGGEYVSVNVMVEPGASPATYEPKPAQLTALADSVAYFSIGVAFEHAWLERMAAANTDMRIVDTAEGIERLALADHHHEGEEGHEDEHEGDDDHQENEAVENGSAILPNNASALYDPHVWLSPKLVAVQARTIANALSELDPAHEDMFNANLNAFLDDIDSLDADIGQTLTHAEGRSFMVFHPSWGYFAADYGLEQIAVEIGGQEPSAQELAALIEEAEHEGIKIVFAQPEFSTRAAETIAKEIGGEVLLISPLAPDWLANMGDVADAFASTLAEE